MCKNQQYTYMLVDEEKDKELLKFLDENEEEEGTVTDVFLNVLLENMRRTTINLEGNLKGKTIRILVDTGSTLTMLNTSVVKKLGLKGVHKNPNDFTMANGSTVNPKYARKYRIISFVVMLGY